MLHLKISEPRSAPAPDEVRWEGHARLGGGGAAAAARLELSFQTDRPLASPDMLWSGKPIEGSQDLPAALSSALLLNFLEPDPVVEEEFNAWYDSEHLPRLLALPGVRSARRYRSMLDSPRYLALFELEDGNVAEGPAWIEGARTPWTARMKRYNRAYRSFLFVPVRAVRS